MLILDYIDSAIDKIRAFDYDIASGELSNEREFQPSPAPLEPAEKTQGCFDGLTMDGVGNVWVARWNDGRVMGFRPDGSLIANIKVPGCRSPTIPCFGGEHPSLCGWVLQTRDRADAQGISSRRCSSLPLIRSGSARGTSSRSTRILGMCSRWTLDRAQRSGRYWGRTGRARRGTGSPRDVSAARQACSKKKIDCRTDV